LYISKTLCTRCDILAAIAALAAATGAFAQSSVTLYGIADIWLGNQKSTVTTGGVTAQNATNTNGVGRNVMGSGGINGSRFGLRGSEDLGGGLKANFLFENGFNLDNGSAAQGGLLFGRQAFAGLSGGFGEVRFGRQYTAYDEARGGSDLMGHSAFSATVGAAGGAFAIGRDYTFRADNTWRYATPNFGGFSAAVSYSLGENKTSVAGAGGVLSLHGAYNNGPIAIFVAHQQEKNTAGANATNPAATTTPFVPLVAGGAQLNLANGGVQFNGTKETHTLISGGYDFGVVKLRAAYNQSKDNQVGGPSADKEFTFGVAAPLGPVTIQAELAGSKNSAVKGRSVGVQAMYNLSKRTFAYVGLQNSKADTIAVAPATITTTTKGSLVAVGLRHAF
jgi:predicted porin